MVRHQGESENEELKRRAGVKDAPGLDGFSLNAVRPPSGQRPQSGSKRKPSVKPNAAAASKKKVLGLPNSTNVAGSSDTKQPSTSTRHSQHDVLLNPIDIKGDEKKNQKRSFLNKFLA